MEARRKIAGVMATAVGVAVLMVPGGGGWAGEGSLYPTVTNVQPSSPGKSRKPAFSGYTLEGTVKVRLYSKKKCQGKVIGTGLPQDGTGYNPYWRGKITKMRKGSKVRVSVRSVYEDGVSSCSSTSVKYVHKPAG